MRFLLGAELGRAAPTRAPMACGMSPRVGASPEAGSMAMKWLAKGKCLIDEPPWPFLMTLRQHLQWAGPAAAHLGPAAGGVCSG